MTRELEPEKRVSPSPVMNKLIGEITKENVMKSKYENFGVFYYKDNLELEKFKVYVYCDPRYSNNGKGYKYKFEGGSLKLKNKPFYIGCAGWNSHLRHLGGNRSSKYVQRRIGRIRKEDLEPIVKVLRMYDLRKKALKLEELLIIGIGRQDLKIGPLLNRADGGIGLKNPNENCRKEMKKGMEKIIKNLWEDPKFRKKHKEKAERQWKDPKFRKMKIKKAKEQWENPEYRIEMSKKFKEAWDRPGYKKSRFGKNTQETKLTEKEVLEIRRIYKDGNISQKELAKRYKVNRSYVQRIIARHIWKDI